MRASPHHVVLRCYAALRDRDPAECARLLHEDVEFVTHGGTISGRAGVIDHVERVRRDHPEQLDAPVRITAEGPDVVIAEIGRGGDLARHVVQVGDGRTSRFTELEEAPHCGARDEGELRRVADEHGDEDRQIIGEAMPGLLLKSKPLAPLQRCGRVGCAEHRNDLLDHAASVAQRPATGAASA